MVTVVVPAYNEAENIGRVVRGLFEQGWQRVIVVDDGSLDDTAKLAAEAGALVLRHEINRGQGAALQTGDEGALALGAEFVVHFDADGQFSPADIAPALRALQTQGVEVVWGSRFLDGRSQIPWLKKYIILPVSRWVNYLFTGMRLSDAHNGFRILTRRAAEAIAIRQDGMAHNTEIVRQIKKNNLKWVEYPVEVRYLEYGQGITGGLKIVGDLLWSRLLK